MNENEKFQDSRIKEAAAMSLPLSGEIVIDAHMHIGNYNQYYIPFQEPSEAEELVKHMDRFGIDHGCVFSQGAQTSDHVLGNDMVIEAARKFPKRFTGYIFINPNYPINEILDDMDRCRGAGLRGIKLITQYHDYPHNGQKLFLVYEYANAYGWPILGHRWEDTQYLAEISQRYSRVSFIVGHAEHKYCEVARKRDNVYISLTGLVDRFGTTEALVRETGSENLLYGSDCVYFDEAYGLGAILYAKISDEDKRLILGLNIKRILEAGGNGK